MMIDRQKLYFALFKLKEALKTKMRDQEIETLAAHLEIDLKPFYINGDPIAAEIEEQLKNSPWRARPRN